MRFSVLALGLSLAAGTLALSVPEQHPMKVDRPVHTMDGWSYEDCGLDTDPVQIQSIEVFPDPPKPGEDLTVRVKGTTSEPIVDGAYADVVVKLGMVKLLSKTFDVCDEARNANASLQCPVKPGEYTVEHTVALPKEIPKAKFTVDVMGFMNEGEEDEDPEPMLCLRLRVDFMKNPFPHKLW
ncbi:unnamed protein product [Cyclocybe aegerita]|uniref:Phosphatidylglycerol/phosphatidylinositol transfer protein n=1 Tax=Cyclocybe aegerita TaxID=1973307 RepID=A0A8S0VSC3_CYCAE|nr:unnamed protein product [Cyclocybe aegerita]